MSVSERFNRSNAIHCSDRPGCHPSLKAQNSPLNNGHRISCPRCVPGVGLTSSQPK